MDKRVAGLAAKYKGQALNILMNAIYKYKMESADQISDDVLEDSKVFKGKASIKSLINSTDEMIAQLNLDEHNVMHSDQIHEIQRILQTTRNHPKFQMLITDIDKLLDVLDKQEQELQQATIPKQVDAIEVAVKDTRSALDRRMGIFESFISKI